MSGGFADAGKITQRQTLQTPMGQYNPIKSGKSPVVILVDVKGRQES